MQHETVETVAAQEQQAEQQQQVVQQLAVGETTHREAEGRKEYGRRRSADEQRQDDDPDRVPKATPRPPGTFPRQVEHQERVEYSYDPGTGQFAAKLVRSSRPVVTGWDPSAPEAVERQIGTWEVTPTGTGVAAESGDSAAQAVPADVQAELKRRAEQEGGPVSESASVRFSHDLVTRETDTRVSLPKRGVASRAATLSAAAEDSPWEAGGSLSGVLNDKYQKVFNGMNERHQQSRANRRRGGGRRRDDLKDSAYTMPQIVIEQEPTQRRVG